MKVYVASSWRNETQPPVVVALREDGHEVYDFRNPSGHEGDCGFAWAGIESRWQEWTPDEYIAALDHPSARSGFAADMRALRAADAVVLVQPCGVSAALEFGWALGAGKYGIVLVPGIREPELMFKMAHRLATSIDHVRLLLQAHAGRTGL